jgi:autoinducer 2-degrading protein
MSVTYVIRFEVVPEKLDQFMHLLDSLLDAMRTEPNFHEAILHRDSECVHHLMLYETWESHEDVLSVQLHRPYRRVFHDSLPELLLKPRDITMWRSIRADRKR